MYMKPFLEALVRKNLLSFSPYSSARDEFSENNTTESYSYLDANENPFPPQEGSNHSQNRYPSSDHPELREYIAEVKAIQFSTPIVVENIVLGNGSDELIDVLIRIFCDPKKDSICISSPTFGMYSVSANINEIEVVDIPLRIHENTNEFILDDEEILRNSRSKNAKILFLCHPNNPTGNTIPKEKICNILENFSGIVVVDEAYIDFVSEDSTLKFLAEYPRLIILHTFSKMWGLAGARCGVAIAHPSIIQLILAVKAPYNVNILTAQSVHKTLQKKETIYQQRNALISERFFLEGELKKIPYIKQIFPSKANFLLIKIRAEKSAEELYQYLKEQHIIVRNFAQKNALENCLRISVGTPEENKKLIEVLRNIS